MSGRPFQISACRDLGLSVSQPPLLRLIMSNVGVLRPSQAKWKYKLYGPVHSDELRLFASQLSYSGLEAAALLASLRASPEPFVMPAQLPAPEPRPPASTTEQCLKTRVSPPKIPGLKRPKEPKVCNDCGCTETCFWRRDKLSGHSLCNACGLFLTKHKFHRPASLSKK